MIKTTTNTVLDYSYISKRMIDIDSRTFKAISDFTNRLHNLCLEYNRNKKVAMYKIGYVNWKISFCEKLRILICLSDITENVFKSKSKIFVLASDILKVLRNHNYFDFSDRWE